MDFDYIRQEAWKNSMFSAKFSRHIFIISSVSAEPIVMRINLGQIQGPLPE